MPAALRAQLNLPEKQGLLVEGVAPESPAAKAGIEQYDILLRAGDKPLTEPRDLVEAVQAAKDGKLTIELIRGGQHKTIEATPAKRPEEARRPVGHDAGPRRLGNDAEVDGADACACKATRKPMAAAIALPLSASRRDRAAWRRLSMRNRPCRRT